MGMRFRKSVSLGKGIRVNFSGSGVGLSLGRRGASVSLGKRGAFLNLGIPGSGLSYRTKIGGSSKEKTTTARKSNPTSNSLQDPLCQCSRVELDNEGTYHFYTKSGEEISNQAEIDSIKRSKAFRELKPKLKGQQRRDVALAVEQSHIENDAFLHLAKRAPEVVDASFYQDMLDSLVLEKYEIIPFDTPKPDARQVQLEVSKEADRLIKGFLGVRKKRERYFDEHFNDALSARQREWEAAKNKYELDQEKIKEEKDAQFLKEYTDVKTRLSALIGGSQEEIEEAAAQWIEAVDLPVEIAAQFEYRVSDQTLAIDLDLPEIEDLPHEEALQLKSGNLKVKDKSQKAMREDYACCVFNVAVFVGANLFNVSPCIKEIILSGYTQRCDKKGEMNDDYIVSVKFERDKFYQVDYSSMNAELFCLQFENRCNKTKTDIFKVIEPFS